MTQELEAQTNQPVIRPDSKVQFERIRVHPDAVPYLIKSKEDSDRANKLWK